MQEVYVQFITNMIESGLHDVEYLETYINMCVANDKITQEQGDALLAKLYPQDTSTNIPEIVE